MIIGGVKKDARSSFFPKDWNNAKIEKSIQEAFHNKTPGEKPGRYVGTTQDGMKIEMIVTKKHGIETAYPIYEAASAVGGAK